MSSEIHIKGKIIGGDGFVKIPLQYVDRHDRINADTVGVYVGATKRYAVDINEWKAAVALNERMNGG